MECKMIESAAYWELQSLVIRLCGRIAHLASSTVSPKPDKWLTQEEVCKALRITKRALQYYRQTGVIPYTASLVSGEKFSDKGLIIKHQ